MAKIASNAFKDSKILLMYPMRLLSGDPFSILNLKLKGCLSNKCPLGKPCSIIIANS